eukprot:4498641-Prymnesium_polylepis.1
MGSVNSRWGVPFHKNCEHPGPRKMRSEQRPQNMSPSSVMWCGELEASWYQFPFSRDLAARPWPPGTAHFPKD